MLTEINSRLARMKAELVAIEYAFDALTLSLPKDQLDAWVNGMQTLSTIRAKALTETGNEPAELEASTAAIGRRIDRIKSAAKLRRTTI
jgi:hypothetical protein